MYLQADWTKRYQSARAAERDLKGLKLPYPQFEGWIETDTDTLLVSPHQTAYIIQCWNTPEARKTIAAYLGLPVYRQEGGAV
jgi:hypothetical protein